MKLTLALLMLLLLPVEHPEGSFEAIRRFIVSRSAADLIRFQGIGNQDREVASTDRLAIASLSAIDSTRALALARESLSDGLQREVVLRTSNGGRTWDRRIVGSENDWFYDIFSLDIQTAWIAGYAGAVLKTTDAGETWKRQHTPTQSALLEIQFADKDTGWAMGEDGHILRTIDGGAHWEENSVPARKWLRALDFYDKRNGWVVGEDAEAYQTTDGGTTWKPRRSKVLASVHIQPNSVATFQTVKFISGKIGFIAAKVVVKEQSSSQDQGMILKTEDSGFTWTTIIVPVDQGLLRAQFLGASETWVIAGLRTALLHTLDGGKTWAAVEPTTDGGMVTYVAFTDSNTGWVAVSYGLFDDRLLYTTDAGRVWVKAKLLKEN